MHSKKYSSKMPQATALEDQTKELARLKKELQRVTEEHDNLKKTAVYFARQSN